MESQQQQQINHHLLPNDQEGGSSKSSNFLCRQSSSRWTPTTEQIRILKDLYYNNGVRSPSADQIQKISAKLRQYGKIEGKNVFYWFQNHKARERQKKRLTTHDQIPAASMQRGVWRSDYQDSTTKSPHNNITSAGAPSSSASGGGLRAATQVGNNYGYGSLAMEKSFRDCSISPTGKGSNGSLIHNFSWAGAADQSYPSTCQILDKKSCFVDEDHEEEEEEESGPELETLPLFPMHGEDISGFCSSSTNRQQLLEQQNCYYNTNWYHHQQPNGNPVGYNYSRTSLELSLNPFGSMGH